MTRREQQLVRDLNACAQLVRDMNDDTLRLLAYLKQVRIAFEGGQ